MPKKHEVTIVNPRKTKKRGSKKRSTKKVAKRRRKKTSSRRPAKRRRRRRNPRAPSVPVARNRRRRSPARRRNPIGGGIRIDLKDDLRYGLWRLGGKLLVAFAVRRFGDPEVAQPSGVGSPTTGARWTLKNLVIGWVAAAVGGEIAARMFKTVDGGQNIYNGGVDLLLTKAFWSEIVHRLGGAGGAAMFGQDESGDAAVLASQAGEGDILDDGQGNRYLLQGGQWTPMMGDMGDALDEAMYEGLEAATPLDSLQEQTALDGYGHLMDSGPAAIAQGSYDRRGSPDPFQATFM